MFPLLLTLSAGAYEAVAATVLNVIGDFYLAISSLDAELFMQVRNSNGQQRTLQIFSIVSRPQAALSMPFIRGLSPLAECEMHADVRFLRARMECSPLPSLPFHEP